MDKRKSFHTNY